MNIGLFTSVFFNNIGNGFIDLGAEYEINKSKPQDSDLIKFSQCANFAASLGNMFLIKENTMINKLWISTMQNFANKFQDKTYKGIDYKEVFSICKLIKLDYLIIPGCVLTVPFVTIYGKLLLDKSKEGCKIIFLGASGNFYNDYEINIVSDFLKELKPFAIMTRDSVAFEKYYKYAEHYYNGIDNVFFVNRLNIPRIETNSSPYIVINLEEPKHKNLKKEIINNNKEKEIIFSDHKPFPYNKVIKMSKKEKTLISDFPMDYLLLYRNAEEVYSDRVHACIPTLTFGNKAFLYSDTKRKYLFENVGIKNSDDLKLDEDNLNELQKNQILFLKEIFEI